MLLSGSRLGSFQIQSAIGAGGMGEVYRARDTTLNRDVAIKVLPDLFSGDPERLARFGREAQVLAALNHPHIGSIYGVVETDEVRGLVLELVEGPTLADRIADGPIPVEEALAIASQIANALEAAHEVGIIHRDLKPANIKVRDDGTVKVLDFGLAKALDPAASTPAEAMNSPTFSVHATHVGVILGTAAYMAPEQAKGRPVDRHADIWAFGAVLYEMLTGTRAFPGHEVSDTLASVIKSEPDWNALPSDTPFLVGRLVRHCLSKDSRQRLGDIRDARLALADASATPALAAAPTTARDTRRERLAWIAAGAGVLAAAAAVALFALGVVHIREAPASPQVVRFTIPAPPGVSGTFAPVISPDGQRVVFAALTPGRAPVLWVHALDAPASQPIAGTDGAGLPFWSPDGRYVGFFAGGMLKKIDVTGGPPVTLCEAPAGRGGAWSSSGDIVFSPTQASALQKVSAAGGTPTAVTTLQQGKELGHRFPQFLPDGRHFLYLSEPIGQGSNGIFLASLGSPDIRPVVTTDAQAAHAAPDTLLYVRGSTLMRQTFDPTRFELRGDPAPVAQGIGRMVGGGGGGYAMFSVSNTGVLVHAASASDVRRRLAWVDRRGAVTPLNLTPGLYTDPALSPDGRFIALVVRDESADHIWVYDIERGTLGKRTFDGANAFPIWSSDGRYVIFQRSGVLMRVPADGSGKMEPLVIKGDNRGGMIPTSWSGDGRLLAFQYAQDVFVREADGSPKSVISTGALEREGRFAPDGRWIAYRSDETGRDEVYVQSYPPGNGKWQISTGGGAQPMWALSGRELFYKSGNRMMVVDIQAAATFKAGTPRVLFETPFVERVGGNPSRYGVSPAGDRFLITTTAPSEDATTVPPFHVVLNWPETVGHVVSVR